MENENQNSHAAKFAFFYLLSLFALIFTALPVGMIIFQVINKFIPDTLDLYQGRFSMEALKFAISAIVIATPIYYVTMRQIVNSIRTGKLDKDSAVRRWLTYFILFATSVVSIVWLISTVNTFLNGDLTIKFMLKALTAIGISAVIFSYYLLDIRRDDIPKPDKLTQIFFVGSLILVIAAFVTSLFIVDSPAETRNKRYDNQVVNNFSQISYEIDNYYENNGSLPASLEDLSGSQPYFRQEIITDSESKEVYQYEVVDEKNYKLCANFKSSNLEDDGNYYNDYNKDEWPHEAGEKCFDREVRTNRDDLKPVPAEDLR
jgi:hypothetical protein